jgi:hypothetical protein
LERIVVTVARTCGATFGAVATAVVLGALPVLAAAQAAPNPSIHVTVQGRAIDWADISAFTRAINPHIPQSFLIRLITKVPADMPSDARYVSYQGKDPGSPSTGIVWISSDARPFADTRVVPSAQVAYEQYVAAIVLAVMDGGTAGPTLEAIYASTPANRADRLALGESFAKALEAVSNQSAAFASNETQWIRSHIIPGMTRSAAYQMLRSQEITAYIHTRGPTSTPNPDAYVTLGGPFNLGCSWSTLIVLSFTSDDRVEAVNIDEPRRTCV